MASAPAVTGIECTLSVLFSNGPHYIFDMKRNLRRFSWDKDRAVRLFERICCFVPGDVVDGEVDCYDLGQVILTKTQKVNQTKELSKALASRKECHCYDVHDGQQRLTTIFLIYIALRDEIDSRSKKGENIEDIEAAITPKHRDGSRSPRIISGSNYLNYRITNRETAQAGERTTPPPTKKRRKQEDQATLEVPTDEDEKLQEIYDALRALLNEMEDDDLDYLYVNLMDRTTVLLCVFNQERRARALVMSQRHGLNIEPVDYCKGVVCRNEHCEDPKETRDKIEQEFDELCDKTDRKIVLAACLQVAQIDTGRPAPPVEGSVDFVEKFLDRKFKASESCAEIFEQIKTVTMKLFNLRNTTKPNDTINPGGLYEGLSDGALKTKMIPSIRFLGDIVGSQKQTEIEKQIELLTIAVFLKVQQPSEQVVTILRNLECFALWLLFKKPSKSARNTRVFKIIKELGTTGESPSLALSSDEKKVVRESLMEDEFSVSRPGNKLPKAILERLNYHHYKKFEPVSDYEWQDGEVYLEGIVSVERQGKCKLGNMVVTTTRGSNCTSDTKKRDRLRKSPFPMSRDAADKFDWVDKDSVINGNNDYIQYAADSLWGLNPPAPASTAIVARV